MKKQDVELEPEVYDEHDEDDMEYELYEEVDNMMRKHRYPSIDGGGSSLCYCNCSKQMIEVNDILCTEKQYDHCPYWLNETESQCSIFESGLVLTEEEIEVFEIDREKAIEMGVLIQK